ncbi:hypothetical protein RB195_018530 [Necator americanus]|uniref:PI-PLC Y-box domain-containing protein n=1 Tax=Necator americanus TaxID=51031 RepID=A0ABR1CBJ9_NECAM
MTCKLKLLREKKEDGPGTANGLTSYSSKRPPVKGWYSWSQRGLTAMKANDYGAFLLNASILHLDNIQPSATNTPSMPD